MKKLLIFALFCGANTKIYMVETDGKPLGPTKQGMVHIKKL